MTPRGRHPKTGYVRAMGTTIGRGSYSCATERRPAPGGAPTRPGNRPAGARRRWRPPRGPRRRFQCVTGQRRLEVREVVLGRTGLRIEAEGAEGVIKEVEVRGVVHVSAWISLVRRHAIGADAGPGGRSLGRVSLGRRTRDHGERGRHL